MRSKYSKTSMFVVNHTLAVVVALAAYGCATVKPTAQQSNLTAGMAQTKIVKGVTTQQEILQLFGSPNIITKNRGNDEVWSYNRMSFESSTSDAFGSLILVGGSSAVSRSTSKTMDLIITFDDNDIVKDFSVISAQF